MRNEMRQELIANALVGRFDELRGERIARLTPEEFPEAASFVSQLREEIVNSSLDRLGSPQFIVSETALWMESDLDCLSSLRSLSLGDALPLREASHPSVTPFLQALDEQPGSPVRRFQLLTERYACPINFVFPAEGEIREYVLTRLMVHDRAAVERRSVAEVSSDDLLLKLNLLAGHAQVTTDLRFLDALNYYYELLPAQWSPHGKENWLLASYLGLYARALAAAILREHTVAHRHPYKRSTSSIADL